jgi:hypothetical protein
MLAFGALSEAAISAAPDRLAAAFFSIVDYEAAESDNVKVYAATEWFISRGSDTPSGTPFPAALEQMPQFERSIISATGFDGLTTSYGNFGLINVGAYDRYLRNFAFDGREIVFRAGDPNDPYADFFDVARLIGIGAPGVDGQMMIVGLRDKAYLFDIPTQPNKYQGTGDLEGGTELTGKPKPLCFGRTKNIPAVPLIAAELVLQVNDGAVSAISAVYDKGYPLTFSANYATPALLRAATIADGSYATCTAYGLLRCGAAFVQITADVNGDASHSGYVETTGTIIRRVIQITGAISDPADIDTISFSNLETAQPAPIGYFLGPDSTETVAQTLSRLSKGIGGYCGFSRLGLLQADVFTAPSGAPAQTFGDGSGLEAVEIIEIGLDTLPAALDPPPFRQRVPYERNWTIINQPYDGVFVVDPTRAAWLSTPYRVATTSQAEADSVRSNHALAQDPDIVESFFALLADAQAEANRRQVLFASENRLYRLRLKVHPFTLDINQTIRVTHSRFGLDSGRLLRLPAIVDRPDDNSIEVRAFG